MPETKAMPDAEDKISVATQWQLMWWRFRKHTLAKISAVIVIIFYLVAFSADFLSTSDPQFTEAQRSLLSPHGIQWIDNGKFAPYVYGVKGVRDPISLKRVYVSDTSVKYPVHFLGKGFTWAIFGHKVDRHLISVEGAKAEDVLFILGTDTLGRDVFSRLMYATRTSLFIGLVGVMLSLFLGILLGGISGYYGGLMDTLIQRVIEIIRSIPTIPLWMGIAAALPQSWSVRQVYFAITIIISLIGWTELARVVRGRFLSLREEDYVTAAELSGCSQMRIISRHMVPSFLSHIIAATTLAIPAMIISETSLSFLGLGLRPPALSWGVLLQDAQNVQSIALTPWLVFPVIPVVIVILALNFLGDGLRDAADPYG
jgi:peptide/nickel transport system permease protein